MPGKIWAFDPYERKMPRQQWMTCLQGGEVRRGLEGLQPDIPWCHFFDLGEGIYTVTPDSERYFGKARGLKIIGQMIAEAVPFITRRGTPKDLSVLDLACGEGGHAIEFAQLGSRVTGIEGRQLYVDRANFAASCYNLQNVSFFCGDVRRKSDLVETDFELVLFLGILHHLSQDDFGRTLRHLAEVTRDCLVIYTHVSDAVSIDKWKLKGPIETADKYRGYLYREHPEEATTEEKARRVRSSLDNTFSFWATEESLLKGMKDVGFRFLSKLAAPHPFGNPIGEHRQIWICRK